METRLLAFDRITYRRKKIDEGVILGKRPWQWTLGNKYSPCNARRTSDNFKVSEISPQKQNFSVYISKHALEIGETYLIVNQDYLKDRVETTVKLEAIEANCCRVSILDEKIISAKKEMIWKPIVLGDQSIFGDVFGKNQWSNKQEEQAEQVNEDPEHLADLLNFFEDCGKQQPDEDLKEIPCEPTRQGFSQGLRKVSEETSSTSRRNIMVTDNFVKGKNQNSFAFVMVNERKEQLSIFTQGKQVQIPVTPKPITVAPAQPLPVLPKVQTAGFSPDEIAIITAIGKGAHIDEIIQRSGVPAGLTAGLLLMLEMSNHIKQHAGRRFTKI